MVEVTGQIEAVRRRVGRRAVGGVDRHVLTLEQELPVTPEDLWVALTAPRRLARWFLPVSGALRAGGRFQLEGNAGGTIESCSPGSAFSATWEFGGAVGRIAVTVAAADDGARLTLEHETDADDPTWAEHGPGATGVGWDLSLLGLALHLEPGGADDPDAWDGGDDGRWFVELSAEAWRAADVAGGTDTVQARARANRTVEAYTGSEDEDDG
ncbi:SRPBCC domain-containing protein [Patulibacter sp.]|uniref:SRPBCC domain-containing protein n=1 Tax=Patulibacter sp. TaxID=1912859 RepID=UPI002723B8C8|nr:SRPBCC domain-containing protein [Patulibacter sp.]MDO9407317.1 SRPBCC domain-containing protein [Patulibacter sp.]